MLFQSTASQKCLLLFTSFYRIHATPSLAYPFRVNLILIIVSIVSASILICNMLCTAWLIRHIVTLGDSWLPYAFC